MSPFEPEQLWEYERPDRNVLAYRFVLISRISDNTNHEYWRCLVFRGGQRVRDRIVRLPSDPERQGYRRIA